MDTKDRTLIKENWEIFRDMVIPSDAGKGQLRDTENAFYAGCAALWVLLMDDIDEIPEDPDNPGMPDPVAAEASQKRFEGIHEELRVFADSKIRSRSKFKDQIFEPRTKQ